MRALLWLVLIAGALWGGYWFAGSTVLERSANQWFDDQAASGMVATRESLSVAGFPSRFDLTVTAPHLADPVSGWGWKAPFAQVFTMTWKPWHIIAALPPDQEIDMPDQSISLHSARLIGSLLLHPGRALALNRMVIEGEGLVASSTLGWRMKADKAVLATTEDTSWQNAHRIGVELTGLMPDAAVAAALPDLGPVISQAHLDATLLFSAPIDRHVAESQPQWTGLRLHDAHLVWGPLQMSAKGDVARASEGFAEGVITLRITDWQQLPGAITALGLAPASYGPMITRALQLLAEGSAKSDVLPDVLEVPLTFKEGQMSLGTLPLGAAPKLGQPEP